MPAGATVRSSVAPLRALRLRNAARRVLVNELDLLPVRAAPLRDGPRRVVLQVEDRAGRQLVAKAAYGRNLDREHAVHAWVAAKGLPVPPILHFVAGPLQLMVTDRVLGPPLDDLDDVTAWRAAGGLLRQLHELSPPPMFPQVRPVHWLADLRAVVVAAHRAGAIGVGVATRVVEVAAPLAPLVAGPVPARLVHGDCMPKHVLFDDRGRPHVIDLEWLRIDDPAWDIAVLTAFDRDRMPYVLDGYRADQEERRRLEQVVPARQLERLARAVCWNAVNGNDVSRCRSALQQLVAEI